jgi:Protein of unknown function (DUF1759).
MEEEYKFQYLIQSTIEGSRAREIVERLPGNAKNSSKVTESLKHRFRKEELLIEYHVRELLGLVIKMPHKAGQSGMHLCYMINWSPIFVIWNQLQ